MTHVILYGSRARGQARRWSDIDLLVVSDIGRERVWQLSRGLETEDGVSLMPLVMSIDEFRSYQRLRLPLYVNICRDGIELWADGDWEAERAAVVAEFEREGEGRSMDPETRETVAVYLDESRRCLAAMRGLEGLGYLDYAASRGYYAAFNAVSAALFVVNVVRGSHSGIKSALSEFLVLPGLIEEEYKDIYEALIKAREWGDYKKRDVDYADDQLRQFLDDAERFVARMTDFLRTRGAVD